MIEITKLIDKEMAYAYRRFGRFHNSHEHLGVLLEEFEEWKDEVKGNTSETSKGLYELIQVAAVALRYVIENGDIDKIALIQNRRHKK